jgi:fructose-1,6-bisphosphatase
LRKLRYSLSSRTSTTTVVESEIRKRLGKSDTESREIDEFFSSLRVEHDRAKELAAMGVSVKSVRSLQLDQFKVVVTLSDRGPSPLQIIWESFRGLLSKS